MSTSIRAAVPADLDTAASVLATAFHNYPWTRWSIPEDRYPERLKEIQRLYLTHAMDHGIVLVDDRLRAVAAFLPPHPPAPSVEVQEQIAELLGARLTALADLTLPAAPADAWTLETVGVDTAHQGRGLGTAVIAAGLALIDEHTATIALETSDDRNERLYQRLGFSTRATTSIPGGPIVYSMHRRTS